MPKVIWKRLRLGLYPRSLRMPEDVGPTASFILTTCIISELCWPHVRLLIATPASKQ
jgi:hypothetical protein